MKRFSAYLIFSVLCFCASASVIFARAGGSGGGHSSGGGGGSFSSGGGSGFSSHSSGVYHSGSGGGGSLITIIILGFVLLFIYVIWKSMFAAASSAFKNIPGPDAKPFSSLDGAARFMAANPGFSEEEFLSKVKKSFVDIQTAWGKGDIKPVRRFLSDGVYQRFSTQLAMMALLKQRDEISNINIGQVFIDSIEQDGLYDILHVSVTGGMNDRFISETDHDLDSPGGYETFTEFWSFLRKRGKGGKDLYFTQACPSCSAPLPADMTDAGNCPYCKTFVNSGEYDWILSEITQVDDYGINSYRSSKTAKLEEQTRKLFAADESFSIQLLEDKASNGYLQIQTARAFHEPARMRRFVGDKAYEKITAAFPSQKIVFNRLYLNDVSVIAAKEEAGKNILHVSVKASFQRALLEGKDAELLDPVVTTKREILVMERDKAAAIAKGSIYAHQCPACGGPAADSLDIKCGYCGSVYNSPKSEWIISDIIDPSSYKEETKGEHFAASADPGIEDNLYSSRDFAFNNVLVIFGADGKFEEKETAMARSLAKKWRYRGDYVDQMIEAAAAGKLSVRMPMGRERIGAILMLMEKAAAVDGTVSPEEQAVIDGVKKEYLSK
jgi:predicted lipid-binding transport protein (Tim44 family)